MTSDPIAAFGVWLELVFESGGELDTLLRRWEALAHLRDRVVPGARPFGRVSADRLHRAGALRPTSPLWSVLADRYPLRADQIEGHRLACQELP